jgi:ubiquinone/menaquinone biosynthesis C-methylase UbiE
VLEVAAGTGIFARALASRASVVVAVDLTPEMLREGKRAAGAAGVRNVLFQEGDGTALPYLDASFDAVVSRLAVHHFEDATVPLREMARVCRPGGSLTVVDMVVIDDDDDQDRFNELERLRDPSHTRALTRTQLRAAVESVSGEIAHTATRENVLDAARWLEQTATPEEHALVIHRAWEDELAGRATTGMFPRRSDEAVELVHHWDLVVGRLSAREEPPPRA